MSSLLNQGSLLETKPPGIWDRFFSEPTAKVIFIASLLYVIGVASVGWDGILSTLHDFRQTQTAITVSSLLKGGPWMAYETPVLGPPWAIPFEFPLYQWIVAIVVKTSGLPIYQTGRLVSLLFFFSSLFPLYKILGFLEISKRSRYIILAFICVSPQYLFWSRTFMIESTALALSIYFLWLVFLCRDMLHTKRINWFILISLTVVGVLASIVKITTFFSFLAGAVLVIAVFSYTQHQAGELHKENIVRIFLVLCIIGLLPFLAVLAWTGYADSLKELNPLASGLTSAAVKSWNFGTLAQKFSVETWSVFYSRGLPDLIGDSKLAIILFFTLILCRKRRAQIAFASLGLYILALLTFTNLHYVHNYYAYANGVFLVVAVGMIITELLESSNYIKRIVGGTFLCALLFFSVNHFTENYWVLQDQQFNFAPIVNAVNSYSDPEDIYIIFGASWSSAIPYYIDRRAVVSSSQDLTSPKLAAMKENLHDYRVGGIIFRTRHRSLRKEDRELINDALHFFNIKPAFPTVLPWYDNSRLFMVFNGDQKERVQTKD